MSHTGYKFIIIAVRNTHISLFALAESGLSLCLCVTLEKDMDSVRMQDIAGGFPIIQ